MTPTDSENTTAPHTAPDPLHHDLDYLRAVPEAGAKAREARNGD